MAITVGVAAIPGARIGLTAWENQETAGLNMWRMVATVIKEANANEMRAIATTIAIAAGIAVARYLAAYPANSIKSLDVMVRPRGTGRVIAQLPD